MIRAKLLKSTLLTGGRLNRNIFPNHPFAPHCLNFKSTVSSAVERQQIYQKSLLSVARKTDVMKLFADKGNYSLLKVLTALNVSKKNVDVEFINPESFKGSKHFQKPQLPLLELNGGVQIFNPNAICCYLLESTDIELLCKPSDRPKVDEILEWDITALQPVTIPYIIALSSGNTPDKQLTHIIHRHLALLNTIIEPRKNCVGSGTTVADIVLWGTLYGILHKNVDFEDTQTRYPAVYRWFEHLSAQEEFKTASKEVVGTNSVAVFKNSFHSGSLPANLFKTTSGNNNESSKVSQPFEEVTEEASISEISRAKDQWNKGIDQLPKRKIRNHPVLPNPNEKNILITSALPYVNNVPHLGNIVGCVLSGDVYARYCKLKGYNFIYICGTDEYGTATETKALEEGLTPREICDKYNKIHRDVYNWFNIEFDYFGRTTTEQQTQIAQDIFWKLEKNGYLLQDCLDQLHCQSCNRFLADRFVEGTCPHCSYTDARGDQCDSCGKLINAVELKSPRCKACKEQPVVKSTRHIFLDLQKIAPDVKRWADKAGEKGQWTNNATRITRGWLQEGLKARCITRDLKWGIPVPMEGFTDKVFYVWFDAPIGYISITATYTDQWEKWWKNPDQVTLVQFMAKDNVPFHSIIFPSCLIGTKENFTLLSNLNATEYLNYEDEKFSKSRGVGVFGDHAITTGIPADIYRFYLLYIRPENQDTAFNWDDFVAKHNSELLNNLGNFVFRALSFIKNNFGGIIPAMTVTEEDYKVIALINREITAYNEGLEKIRIKDGIRNILAISKLGNQFIQSNKPWVLIKGSEEDRARAGSVLALAANICALLGQLVSPYMPNISKEMQSQTSYPMDYDVLPDAFVPILPEGHAIGTPNQLFKTIETKIAVELRSRFSGKRKNNEGSGNEGKKEEKSANIDASTVADLEQKVAKQGEVVRKAKLDNAEKSIITAEVAKLLDLKKQLALSKGEDISQLFDKKKGKGKK